ncbi:MAG: uroporphyrinogen decarboxylase family protein [bacterium]
MTSKERLIKVFNREKPDRVPISLYEFDGHYDSWIYNYQEYVEILEYAKGKTDKMSPWNPTADKPVLFYGEVSPEDVKNYTWQEGSSVYTRTIIRTPEGELTTLKRQDEGVHTTWTIEYLCKDAKDAERLFSIEYFPWKPSINSFFKKMEEIGNSGIVTGEIPDALCLTVELFGFYKFLMLYTDNRSLIFRLMDFFQERLYNYLEYLLSNGVVTVYRICGPEYATPPYLSPREFRSLVVRYDKEIIELLHKYGSKARLHSHGKVKNVLEFISEMNIDAIDPLEPPPDGDITLKEARKILGEKVVLIGNIEERLFEVGTKSEIEIAVKTAIEEGSNSGPFILCPTAMPLTTPLDRKIQENIIHYIDCSIKYGKL